MRAAGKTWGRIDAPLLDVTRRSGERALAFVKSFTRAAAMRTPGSTSFSTAAYREGPYIPWSSARG